MTIVTTTLVTLHAKIRHTFIMTCWIWKKRRAIVWILSATDYIIVKCKHYWIVLTFKNHFICKPSFLEGHFKFCNYKTFFFPIPYSYKFLNFSVLDLLTDRTEVWLLLLGIQDVYFLDTEMTSWIWEPWNFLSEFINPKKTRISEVSQLEIIH